MPDMLVKLYTLPPLEPVLTQQKEAGIDIRRALVPEKHIIVDWVAKNFESGWPSECEVALSRHPVSCFIAVENGEIIGFACHDATYKNFLGPMGVDPKGRGRGVGKALLLACLHAMAAQGYGYAIIGWVGPAEFYSKAVGAVLIEDSEPGIYRGMLRNETKG